MRVEERRYSASRLGSEARALLDANPALIPCLLAMAALLALGATEAGFYPDVWYGATLFVVLLVVVTALVLPLPRPSGTTIAATALLAGFAAWAYASMAWAGETGTAWDGANRTLLYLAVFALFALWPLDGRGATILIGAFGLGVAAIGLVELLRVNGAEQAGTFFIDARLAEPTGYMNANAALWTLGSLACLHLVSRRDVQAGFRGIALGSAGLLGALALMAQSRGWLIALPIALVVHLALMPGRLRTLIATVAVLAGVVAVSGPATAVHDDFDLARFDALVADATTAILIMAGCLAVAGFLAALADRRITDAAPEDTRPGPLAALAGVGIAVIAVVAVASLSSDRLSEEWNDFKEGDQQAGIGSSRFSTAGGSNRYDFWAVSWEAFKDHPVAGLGMDNFQAEYLLRGTSEEQPRFAHSLEMGVLAQTGFVGTLLFIGWLAMRAARCGERPARSAAPCGRGGRPYAVRLLARSRLAGLVLGASGPCGACGRRARHRLGAGASEAGGGAGATEGDGGRPCGLRTGRGHGTWGLLVGRARDRARQHDLAVRARCRLRQAGAGGEPKSLLGESSADCRDDCGPARAPSRRRAVVSGSPGTRARQCVHVARAWCDRRGAGTPGALGGAARTRLRRESA